MYAAYAHELLYTLSKDSAFRGIGGRDSKCQRHIPDNPCYTHLYTIHHNTPHHIAHLTSFDTVRNICRLVERGHGLHFPTQWLVFILTSS